MIAGFYVSDIGADLLDDAGRFVPEHRGQRMWIETVHEMQVGVTQPGDGGADQYLARTGFRQADVLDHQRLVYLIQDGGLHRCSPSVLLWFLLLDRRSAPPQPDSICRCDPTSPKRGEVRPRAETKPPSAIR